MTTYRAEYRLYTAIGRPIVDVSGHGKFSQFDIQIVIEQIIIDVIKAHRRVILSQHLGRWTGSRPAITAKEIFIAR